MYIFFNGNSVILELKDMTEKNEKIIKKINLFLKPTE